MTSAPCFARCRAVLLPSPRLPPVTRAIGTVMVLMVCSWNHALPPMGGGRFYTAILLREALSLHPQGGNQTGDPRTSCLYIIPWRNPLTVPLPLGLARLRSMVDL